MNRLVLAERGQDVHPPAQVPRHQALHQQLLVGGQDGLAAQARPGRQGAGRGRRVPAGRCPARMARALGSTTCRNGGWPALQSIWITNNHPRSGGLGMGGGLATL